MARKRESQKLSKEYDAVFTELERLQISWLIANEGAGYNFQDSQYVAHIIEEFDLEAVGSVAPETLENESTYKLSGYEIQFLDKLAKGVFDRSGVPANRVVPMLALYRAFEAILNAPAEKEEE